MKEKLRKIAEASLAGFELVTNGFLTMKKLADQQNPEIQAKWALLGNQMAKTFDGLSEHFQTFFRAQKTGVETQTSNMDEGKKDFLQKTEPATSDIPVIMSRNMWNSRNWSSRVSKQQWLAAGRKTSDLRLLRPRTHDAYVTGIPWHWGVHQLFQLFRNCGKIEQIFLPSQICSGNHRGYAFVRFQKPGGLESACQLTNRKVEGFANLLIKIKPSVKPSTGSAEKRTDYTSVANSGSPLETEAGRRVLAKIFGTKLPAAKSETSASEPESCSDTSCGDANAEATKALMDKLWDIDLSRYQ